MNQIQSASNAQQHSTKKKGSAELADVGDDYQNLTDRERRCDYGALQR